MRKEEALIYISDIDGERFITEQECIDHDIFVTFERHHKKMIEKDIYKTLGFKFYKLLKTDSSIEKDDDGKYYLLFSNNDPYYEALYYNYMEIIGGEKVKYRLFDMYDDLLEEKIIKLLK